MQCLYIVPKETQCNNIKVQLQKNTYKIEKAIVTMALWYHCREAISITIQRDINKVTEEIVDILPDNIVLAANICKTFVFPWFVSSKQKRLKIFSRYLPQFKRRLASWIEKFYRVVKCSLSQELSRNIYTFQGVDILYDKLIFFIVQDYKKDKMDVNVSIAF